MIAEENAKKIYSELGRRIYVQMRDMNVSAGALAGALGIARQSVYDLFKSEDLSVKKLALISEILNYDFFKDIQSKCCPTDNGLVAKSIDRDFYALAGGEYMPIVTSNFRRKNILEGFLKARTHNKPLVLFYDYYLSEDLIEDPLFTFICDTCKIKKPQKNLQKNLTIENALVRIADNQKVMIFNYSGIAYNNIYDDIQKVIQSENKKAILMIPVINEIRHGINGGVEYHGVADDLFVRWKEDANIALFAPNYWRRRELYCAYLGNGVFDKLANGYIKDDEIERRIVDLVVGERVLNITDVEQYNKNGITTITLEYQPATEDELEIIHNNGVNNNPKLSMWFKIKSGILLDHQYK